MISQTAEYALRAVVHLAGHADHALTTAQIAKSTNVPAGYLAKVMQSLARTRIVRSQRGLKGGFKLAHAPNDLTILAVVNAVDPIRRYASCPLGLPSHGTTLCHLHLRLDDAATAVERAFGETTIAELLAGPRNPQQPCRFPVEGTRLEYKAKTESKTTASKAEKRRRSKKNGHP
ncbi:MAG: Rrf2 family transcriptional regulator [Planctomycetes bacterium]|nr:Rrf2 family transcriptional regulator [Planctomycetota bacterium]